MKSNIKYDVKNYIAEISISNMVEEDETELHNTYMSECMLNEAMFVNTAGMSNSDAKYMCGMSYMKNRSMLMEGAGELSEKQNGLPEKIKIGILKRYQKAGTLSEKGAEQLKSLSAEKESVEETAEPNKNNDEMQEMKAEPTAVFIETPAPPSGNITPDAAIEGLKIDEKLKKEDAESQIKNPDLQSANA